MGKTKKKIWDGRGDALESARLTIAAGRMADDLRLGETHFRVMAHIGRQNDKRGWLRVSQSELAGRWNVHRSTVNRAFKDLVTWEYLLQLSQEKSGESFCLYKVALDSEGENCELTANRVSRQKRTPTRGECDSHGTPPGSGSAAPETHMCTPGEHTCVRMESTPPIYIARAHRQTPTDADSLPHLSARGGRRGRVVLSNDIDLVLERVRADAPTNAAKWAVDAILSPLCRTRRLDAPSIEGSLRALAEWIGQMGLTEGEASIVVSQLMEARRATVKPSDIERAVRRVVDGRQGWRVAGRMHGGDAAMMLRWPTVLAALEARLGPEIVSAWFATVAIEAVDGAGVVTLVTHMAVVAKRIEQEYEAHFRAALSAGLGVPCRAFKLRIRPAAAALQAQNAATPAPLVAIGADAV